MYQLKNEEGTAEYLITDTEAEDMDIYADL